MSVYSDEGFDVPVCLHVWTRCSFLYQVMQKIRQLKPRKLYINGDGPRLNVLGDVQKAKMVRKLVDREIDWDCKVYTRYFEVNQGMIDSDFLGTNKHPPSAIYTGRDGEKVDLLYDEEMVVFLEDDDLPDLSFFYFCKELLQKYKDDDRVFRISGNNFQNGARWGDTSYYFSYLTHGWGAGVWPRKHLEYFNAKAGLYEDFKALASGRKQLPATVPAAAAKYYMNEFNSVYHGTKKGLADDYLLLLYAFLYDKYTILPQQNLVRNIGWCPVDGTNCLVENHVLSVPAEEMTFPLKHPEQVALNAEADNNFYKNFLKIVNV